MTTGFLNTLHTETADALAAHDWSGDIADTVNVEKVWSAKLEHREIHATEPTLSVVPGDLKARRVDSVDFAPSVSISVAIRAKADTDARKIALADFSEAVAGFLTALDSTLPLIEIELVPLFDLELLETHRIWFSLLVLRFGGPDA